MKKVLIVIMTIFLLSCEDVITLDLDQTVPVYIIEGLVLDENINQYVRVTRSVDFYATGGAEPITSATVTVDDGENTYSYSPVTDPDTDSLGYYFSDQPFAGEIGKEYNLRVEIDGQVFTATDELFRVAEIDSLASVINEEEFEDPEVDDQYYEILFYTTEPQETRDFYLFKFYRNGELLRDDVNDIYFSDDELLAENIEGVPTAGFYQLGDSGTVEVYSISNAAFVYYNDLINLLLNDGGLFGSPPVNPRTNIQGGALGYFQASAVKSARIVITD